MCNILSEIDRFGARCPPNFQVKSPLSIVSCRIVDIHSEDDIANILPWFPPPIRFFGKLDWLLNHEFNFFLKYG